APRRASAVWRPLRRARSRRFAPGGRAPHGRHARGAGHLRRRRADAALHGDARPRGRGRLPAVLPPAALHRHGSRRRVPLHLLAGGEVPGGARETPPPPGTARPLRQGPPRSDPPSAGGRGPPPRNDRGPPRPLHSLAWLARGT